MMGILQLTIRELRSRFIVIGLFGIATLLWLALALAVNLDVVDGQLEAFKFFGQMQEFEHDVTIVDPETGEQEEHTFRPFGEDPLRGLVVGVQQVVAGATFWVLLFLGLFATGSLVVSFQERGQVDLLLSKPISRTSLLGGRLLGVATVIAVLVLYVLGAVWLVMSLKSGVWNPGFLLAAFGILLMFLVMYSVVTLMSVLSDSNALALIITLGVIVVSLIVAAAPDVDVAEQIGGVWGSIYVGLYHILPKFAGATGTVWQLVGGERVEDWYSVGSSLVFGAVLYGLAFWRFDRKDF